VQQAESRAKALAKEQEKKDDAAREIAAKLEGSNIVLQARAGEGGKLFGSITASDIAEAVSSRGGQPIEHRQVLLEAPIKEVGSFEVPVTLTRNVRANVTVEVQAEE
jgi:large subunit ribosomal protein L9